MSAPESAPPMRQLDDNDASTLNNDHTRASTPTFTSEKELEKHRAEAHKNKPDGHHTPPHLKEGKHILTELECYSELGFSFSKRKKWMILTVIFLIQVSMNFNSSLYSNGLTGIEAKFDVSAQAARVGAAVFLITYAFGCELFAPFSEELGRWPILQGSLFLVNLFNLPVVLAPNFGSLIAGRALGGLCSAGGSVTLGLIADLFTAEDQQYAVAFIVFSSVGGSVLGPIVGGFVTAYLAEDIAWKWCIWIQLIFGGVVQAMHFFLVPETRTTVLLDRIAKKRRAAGETNVYGPNEVRTVKERFFSKEIITIMLRPFVLYFTEPIVLCLSLLSGFSDAIVFMQIQALSLVYTNYGFNDWQNGLAFVAFLIGYFIAWGSFIPAIKRNIAQREAYPDDEHAQFESRLWWLLWTVPCLPIGLFGFAWTCASSDNHIPWIASMIFVAIVGIANYAIYMATIDYMICAYGPYSASATGGNGWSRDFLAGVLTLAATPFFSNIGPSDKHLQYGNTILACIASLLVLAVYVIYWKGPTMRKRSKFAEHLSQQRHEDKLSNEKKSSGKEMRFEHAPEA
ncbi:putative MFS multidrug transporter [Pseudohyphozyma bogoriensis]|nr:putative MFS multidrug transporter [Pseudohyphozyma bogoriensis]